MLYPHPPRRRGAGAPGAAPGIAPLCAAVGAGHEPLMGKGLGVEGPEDFSLEDNQPFIINSYKYMNILLFYIAMLHFT